MSVMSTCLGRLGSRYSLMLDPHRNRVEYGALGMICQDQAEMVAGLQRHDGSFAALPFCAEGERFYMLDQHFSATSVIYEAFDLAQSVQFRTEIIAPFWPQDIAVSTIPAYIVKFTIKPIKRIRAKVYSCSEEPEYWSYWKPEVVHRKGILRFGFKIPDIEMVACKNELVFHQPVHIKPIGRLQGDGNPFRTGTGRVAPLTADSENRIFGLSGNWTVNGGFIEVPYDVSEGSEAQFYAGFCTYCDSPMFERFGQPMRLKYTELWKNADDVCRDVKCRLKELLQKSRAFAEVFEQSSLPLTSQYVMGFSFQTFLMNTLWAVGTAGQTKEWFSVWEGNCLLNSTVDVEYNNALFYFSCWPELLEMIFAQWAEHANDAERERKRILSQPQEALHADSWAKSDIQFPGLVLEHDMGAGWTANGQSYAHAMPVEENSNFLLMLYAHGKWWKKPQLYRTYESLVTGLTEFLLFTDTTGNGFPNVGTANTIDDGCPALQYGREGVYLGIKRLAALHAAGRMLKLLGHTELAGRCEKAVTQGLITLEKGWLGDHYPVCLDASTKGLLDANTAKPVPFDLLPGWDHYNVHTANGLLYLLMVDDLPDGFDRCRIRQDLVNSRSKTLTPYGCYHLGKDDIKSIWVSLNLWRDSIAGYFGVDLLSDGDRYWNLQEFSNSAFADKVNCFAETAQNNNLMLYPRSASSFGLLFGVTRMKVDQKTNQFSVDGIRPGMWPLLAMADWEKGVVTYAVVELDSSRLKTQVIHRPVLSD